MPGAAPPPSSSAPATSTAAPTTTSSSTAPAASCSTVDTASHCGQWDTVNTGLYTLYLDQWVRVRPLPRALRRLRCVVQGISGATGSDCAQIQSVCGSTMKWTTAWNWAGGSGGVKTYTNVNLNTGLNKQLSAIKSIPVRTLRLRVWAAS